MSCDKCNSERVIIAQGHCNDCFCLFQGEKQYFGYVPEDIGIGCGDDVYFKYCLNCGKIQGEFPLPLSKFETES